MGERWERGQRSGRVGGRAVGWDDKASGEWGGRNGRISAGRACDDRPDPFQTRTSEFRSSAHALPSAMSSAT